MKTAYEMRISDGSSDVCSSDLDPFRLEDNAGGQAAAGQPPGCGSGSRPPGVSPASLPLSLPASLAALPLEGTEERRPVGPVWVSSLRELGRPSGREGGCQYV